MLSKLLEADEQEQMLTQQLRTLQETVEEKRGFYDTELRQLLAELEINKSDLQQDVTEAHNRFMARGRLRMRARARLLRLRRMLIAPRATLFEP